MEAKDFCAAAVKAVFQKLADDMDVQHDSRIGAQYHRENLTEIASAVAREIENVSELLSRGRTCECNRSEYDYFDGTFRKRVEAWEYNCKRCDHHWITSSKDALPKRCPECGSRNWNKMPEVRSKKSKQA